MSLINENFLKLQDSYLFSTIAKKVAKFTEENPEKEIIKLGIGDVTRPIVPACIEAMHKAVDEIGTKEDMAAIRQAGLCGSSVICTAHGDDMESIKKRFADTDMFERYVFLEGRTCPGKVKALYDAGGERLW